MLQGTFDRRRAICPISPMLSTACYSTSSLASATEQELLAWEFCHSGTHTSPPAKTLPRAWPKVRQARITPIGKSNVNVNALDLGVSITIRGWLSTSCAIGPTVIANLVIPIGQFFHTDLQHPLQGEISSNLCLDRRRIAQSSLGKIISSKTPKHEASTR